MTHLHRHIGVGNDTECKIFFERDAVFLARHHIYNSPIDAIAKTNWATLVEVSESKRSLKVSLLSQQYGFLCIPH